MTGQYKLAYWLIVFAFVMFIIANVYTITMDDFSRGAYAMSTGCFMLMLSLLLLSFVDDDDDDDWMTR